MKIERDSKGRFIKGSGLGSDNFRWSKNPSYNCVHFWIKKELGKANLCEQCGSIEKIQWANKSGNYKRELNDWIQLCILCHRKYDGITKLTKKQSTEIKFRYHILGFKQKILAKLFKVDQGTISNIINNKIQFYV